MTLNSVMPCRAVRAFNQNWNVPRHINPLPHGWQVRFARSGEPYYSKSFANSKFGSPEAALDAAIDDVIDQLGHRFRQEELSLRSSTPPMINFGVVRQRGGRQDTLNAHVSLLTYKGKRKLSSVYIGTKKSLTQEKVDKAIKKLIADWYWVTKRVPIMGIDNLIEVSPPKNSIDELPRNAVLPKISIEEIKSRYF